MTRRGKQRPGGYVEIVACIPGENPKLINRLRLQNIEVYLESGKTIILLPTLCKNCKALIKRVNVNTRCGSCDSRCILQSLFVPPIMYIPPELEEFNYNLQMLAVEEGDFDTKGSMVNIITAESGEALIPCCLEQELNYIQAQFRESEKILNISLIVSHDSLVLKIKSFEIFCSADYNYAGTKTVELCDVFFKLREEDPSFTPDDPDGLWAVAAMINSISDKFFSNLPGFDEIDRQMRREKITELRQMWESYPEAIRAALKKCQEENNRKAYYIKQIALSSIE